MLIIIHGSDTARSRKYFFEQKEKIKDSYFINGANLDVTSFVQLFEGGDLFTVPKDFLIDALIGKRKKSRELDSLIDVINKNSLENNIYIWEGKELTPASLKQFKNATSKLFKLPQSLFIFLDQFKPGNGKNLIKLFHEIIESTDPDMVFFMIVRQVRLLLYIKEPADEPIDEIKRMSWQMGKLRSQAAAFDAEELKALYSKLFEIEKGLKTGTLPMNIVQSIDLLLMSI